MPVVHDDFSLGMEGIVNARELGGIKIGDKTIRRGLLLRTGEMSKMTARDLDRLELEYHVSIVFDLRTRREMFRAPDRAIPGSRLISLPVLDDKGVTNDDMAMFKTFSGENPAALYEVCKNPRAQEFARNMYTSFVINEYTQLQYTAFLEMLINDAEGAVLWHCTQGKDRTGLAAALILSALGADRDTIMDDFSKSALTYDGLLARMLEGASAAGCDDVAISTMKTFVSVNPPYFAEALDLIDREYGGMHRYLTEILGISDQEMEILRERYLE